MAQLLIRNLDDDVKAKLRDVNRALVCPICDHVSEWPVSR